MKRILLGLGSNKSFSGMDSLHVLKCACRELCALMKNVTFSSVYRTRAMYVQNQNDFYNMTAMGYVDDDENPFEFLEKIHQIEAAYGRDRSKEIRFGPRPLDIDIELFGNDSINTENLQIPHLRIKERAFVLIPAIEILKKSSDVNDIEIFRKYSELLSAMNVKVVTDGLEKVEADDNTLVKLSLPQDFFS